MARLFAVRWPAAERNSSRLARRHVFGSLRGRRFLGRIGRDQLIDYARRKSWSIAEAERWLAQNLAEERATAEVPTPA